MYCYWRSYGRKIIILAAWAACAAAISCGRKESRELFNGRNLDRWKHVGEGAFSVENGMLKTVGGMGLLWYEKEKFENCTIHIEYKTAHGSDNSGVFIRIPEEPQDPWAAVHTGYEIQIDDSGDERHCTGTIYSITQAMKRPGVPKKWNIMDIELDGNRTRVWVNGTMVTCFKEGDEVPPRKHEWEPERGKRPEKGYIGIQNHQPEDTVFFRKIAVFYRTKSW